jgi:GNAT superfamily N-acetyltransferase
VPEKLKHLFFTAPFVAQLGEAIQRVLPDFDRAKLIEEAHRGQGYGRQSMLALEEKAKGLGLRTLALHVFAHNAEARALYEGLGYEIKSLNMEKLLT